MCSETPEVYMNKHWLVNDPMKVVEDSLIGLVKCNPKLALLDFGNVVIRRDHASMDNVKILSGGYSGHEPSYGGFVGTGMLTASVQGAVYCSPSPNLILRTIKEMSRRHENGIVLIIQNNISNRLAFGLAMERAENIPNVKVRLIKVDDFVQANEKRGLTGTLLIQKIAGAMSEDNKYIYEISSFCEEVMQNMATVVVALKSAKSPLYEIISCLNTIPEKEMDYGAGLHGQRGYLRTALKTSHETVTELLKQITLSDDNKLCGAIKLDPDTPVLLLVNNLGTTSKIEELIFLNELVTQLQELEIRIDTILCNSYVTALEMCGFSLTIMNLTNPDILTYLTAACEAPYWKSFCDVVLPVETSVTLSTAVQQTEIQPKPNRGPRLHADYVPIIENVLNFACGALISCEKQLNIMDSESGDADTGTNLFLPATKIIDYLSRNKLRIAWPFMLFQELSKILEYSAQSLQSCMYAIMFEAAARPFLQLGESDFLTFHTWFEAFIAAVQAVQRYGKTSAGYKTMYDPLCASKEVFEQYMENRNAPYMSKNILDIVGLATVAAEDAAIQTKPIDKEFPDPGAHAIGIWMRAVYEALKLHSHHLSTDPTFRKIGTVQIQIK